MTAGTAIARHTVSSGPTARGTLIRLTMRQIRRGTLLVATVCAGMSALVATQYRVTFEGELSQGALRALAENPAIRILFGTPVALDDPGGFTVWRTGTPLLLLAGTWIMLAAIRITRGEEDAGHWDLVLAGPVRAADLMRYCLVALAASAAVISTGVGVAMVAAGTDPVGAVAYATGVLGLTLTFATVGLAAAQVMPSRSAAVGVAVGFLGFALLLRMLADGVAALAWSAWLSPLGLIARVAPYAENRVSPLLVLACFPVVFALGAVVAVRSRDLGEGLLVLSTQRPPRTPLLGSTAAFAVRRALGPTAGWTAGIAAYFLIVGALISSVLDFFEQNPRFAELAAAAGFSGLNSAEGFAAALFTLLAIPTGLYAASRLGAFVRDEITRRSTMLFASPIPRARRLGIEIAVTAAGLVALHAVAAVAMWAGAALTGAGLGPAAAFAGALNTAPVAGLALGAAASAIGWLPSAVGIVGAVPVVGGFLLDVTTENLRGPAWITDISPFAHVAAVPLTSPHWAGTASLLLISAVLAIIGLAGYDHRDLRS